MKLETKGVMLISIVIVLAVGFIGFQALQVEPPETKVIYKTVIPERRITTDPFVERTPESVTTTHQEVEHIPSTLIETTSVPESVPTAESNDADIREFQAWISSVLTEENTLAETEQEDFNKDDEIDYEVERTVIKSVIQDQWANSLETYDIEGYMSAIWEDDFFYVSDMGTPDNLDDDIIFRGGQQEREGTLKMFDANKSIELNLYRNGDVEFLSDTVAMADYDYDLRLNWSHGEKSNPSGRMFFILELRENGEWRILEWYDYATPSP